MEPGDQELASGFGSVLSTGAAHAFIESQRYSAPRRATLFVREQGDYRPASNEEVLTSARRLIGQRVRRGTLLGTTGAVREFLRMRLGPLEYEVFLVLMLDSQHRLIEAVELFRGTLSQSPVYPREVLREAIARNAAAVILSHNHPSGHVAASREDRLITQALKQALQLVDVRVLDHMIVAGEEVSSFAEQGWL